MQKLKILIVDDDEALLSIFQESEYMSDYCLGVTQSSEEALKIIKDDPPDLFLLDLMLPGMSGMEVCSYIKNFEGFNLTPVIFITAHDEINVMIKAFETGASDYIVKPIVMEEVSVRIKVHLELAKARKKVEDFVENMTNSSMEKSKQLMHADRLATLGTLSAGLAHEIKNPTTFISGNVQTMEQFWGILKEETKVAIENSSPQTEKLEFILEEMPGLISGIKDGVTRIIKVVDGLKAFARKDGTKGKLFCLSESIENSLHMCRKVLEKDVKVEKSIAPQKVKIYGDAQQMEQVLINIFMNAVDAMEGKKDALLAIKTSLKQDKITI